MNDQLFDDLARALAKPGNRRSSRRALLRSVGLSGAAGFAASMLGHGTTTAALQDATPPPVPAPEPIDPPINIVGVSQKAFELGLDVDSLFRYVADEVRYEAYSGALRGETGTLWSMAGNSVDQALLLAALLKEALVEVRFAIGTLDDATAQQLVDSMVVDAETFRTLDQRAQLANLSLDGSSALDASSDNGTTPELTPEEQQALEQAASWGQALIAEADQQITESVQLITDALTAKNISLPEPGAPVLPDRERQQHVWVQYADGTEWVDLDPSFPNAEAGRAYGTAAQTLDELPAELDHLVRFRIVKEVVSGGAPARQDVVILERKARELVGVPVSYTNIKQSTYKSLGVSIGTILEGTVNYVPTFLIGRDVLSADQLVQFGTGEGVFSELGGETSSEGDTLAEWLITEIVTPDGALEPIERVIFDRVGIEKRAESAAAGTPIDLTAIPPIELVDLGEAGTVYPPMLNIYGLAVVGGRVPAWFFDSSRVSDDVLANFSFAEHGFHFLRDQLSLEYGLTKGHRFYVNAPNVTGYAIEPANITEGQSPEFSIEADLIYRSVAPLPVTSAQPEDNAGILAGVLAHVAERVSLEARDWAGEAQPQRLPAATSVGRVFEEAKKQGIAVAVLTPGTAEADLATLDVSAQASTRIKDALASGFAVIVPEKSVQIDGAPLSGWWEIDLATSKTADRMENGRGNVALRSSALLGPMAEFAALIEADILAGGPAIRAIGCATAAGFFAVAIVMAAVGVGEAAAGGSSVAAAVGKGAAQGGIGGGAVALACA
jgi:hypothetical protein